MFNILKRIKNKDAGWTGTEFIDVKNINDVSLSLIVKTVKSIFGEPIKKITNGKLDKNGTGSPVLRFQVYVKKDENEFTWMETSIGFNVDFDVLEKLYKEGKESGKEYLIKKFRADLNKKLQEYTGKTIYEDKSLKADSKPKDTLDKISSLINVVKSVRDMRIKPRDAVSLRKGDWFINNYQQRWHDTIHIYKVIDDKKQERNGFSASILVEEYYVDTMKDNPKIEKRGTTTMADYKLKDITVFNSVNEAMTWLKRKIKNESYNNSKDSIKDAKEKFTGFSLEPGDFKDNGGYRFWNDEQNRAKSYAGQQLIKWAMNMLDYLDDFKDGYIKQEVKEELINIKVNWQKYM